MTMMISSINSKVKIVLVSFLAASKGLLTYFFIRILQGKERDIQKAPSFPWFSPNRIANIQCEKQKY